jgi:hypothetical protein
LRQLVVLVAALGVLYTSPNESANAEGLSAFKRSCNESAAVYDRHAREAGQIDVEFQRVLKQSAEKICNWGKTRGIPFWQRQIREQEAQLGILCGGPVVRQVLANTRKNFADYKTGWEASCKKAASKPASREACTTPPSPSASRTSSTNMCFKAKNTNSDARCVYSFTYLVGGKRLNGGNVDAGKTESRCSLQPGVDIAFEKWTKSGASAR